MLINWYLYDNQTLIVNDLNVKCEFSNNVLIYKNEDSTNEININKETYIRENNEYKLEIDFKKKTMELYMNELKNSFLLDIECLFTKNKDKIILEYKYDEEIKKIIIEML